MPRQDGPCGLPFRWGQITNFSVSSLHHSTELLQENTTQCSSAHASPSTAGLAIPEQIFLFSSEMSKLKGVKRALKVTVSPPPDRRGRRPALSHQTGTGGKGDLCSHLWGNGRSTAGRQIPSCAPTDIRDHQEDVPCPCRTVTAI